MPNGDWFHRPQSRLNMVQDFQKKWQDLCPSQSTVEYNLTNVGDAMNLEYVLGQIQADCCNMHMGGSSQAVSNNCSMAQ